jgi:hypothetical protein
MAKREQPEYVNPIRIMRLFYLSLAALPIELREMVLALYCHSGAFFEKADVDRGYFLFSATVSQGQLAEFCGGLDTKSVYRRLVRLNTFGIVEWDNGPGRGKGKAKEYHVEIDSSNSKSGVQTPGEPDWLMGGLPPESPGIPRNESGVQEAESGAAEREWGVEQAESGVQTPDTVFDLALRTVTPVEILDNSTQTGNSRSITTPTPVIYTEIVEEPGSPEEEDSAPAPPAPPTCSGQFGKCGAAIYLLGQCYACLHANDFERIEIED